MEMEEMNVPHKDSILTPASMKNAHYPENADLDDLLPPPRLLHTIRIARSSLILTNLPKSLRLRLRLLRSEFRA